MQRLRGAARVWIGTLCEQEPVKCRGLIQLPLKNSRREPGEWEGENIKPNREVLLLEHRPDSLHLPTLSLFVIHFPLRAISPWIYFISSLCCLCASISAFGPYFHTHYHLSLILLHHSFCFHLRAHRGTLVLAVKGFFWSCKENWSHFKLFELRLPALFKSAQIGFKAVCLTYCVNSSRVAVFRVAILKMLYSFVNHIIKNIWTCSEDASGGAGCLIRWLCTNTHCVKKSIWAMCLIEPVDVAFVFVHMDTIYARVCVILCAFQQVRWTCTMIVCEFMVHAATLLISVSLMRYMYSIRGSLKCCMNKFSLFLYVYLSLSDLWSLYPSQRCYHAKGVPWNRE